VDLYRFLQSVIVMGKNALRVLEDLRIETGNRAVIR